MVKVQHINWMILQKQQALNILSTLLGIDWYINFFKKYVINDKITKASSHKLQGIWERTLISEDQP